MLNNFAKLWTILMIYMSLESEQNVVSQYLIKYWCPYGKISRNRGENTIKGKKR